MQLIDCKDGCVQQKYQYKAIHYLRYYVSMDQFLFYKALLRLLLMLISHDAVVALWKPKLLILLRGARYFGNHNSFES